MNQWLLEQDELASLADRSRFNDQARGRPLLHSLILVGAAGFTTIISASGQSVIEVYELVLWFPVTHAEVAIADSSIDPFDGTRTLLYLNNLPAQTGFSLAYSPEPHFVCRAGAGFYAGVENGTAPPGSDYVLTGFARYRRIGK